MQKHSILVTVGRPSATVLFPTLKLIELTVVDSRLMQSYEAGRSSNTSRMSNVRIGPGAQLMERKRAFYP